MPNPVINRRVGGNTPPGFLLLEDGTYLLLEDAVNRLAVTLKGVVQPGSLTANTNLALTDEALVAASGTSYGGTIQRLLDTVNILTASGALGIDDYVPIHDGVSGGKITIRNLLKAINGLTDATLPLTGEEYIPIADATDAKRIQLLNWLVSAEGVKFFDSDRWLIKGAVIGTDATAVTPLGDQLSSSVSGAGATTGVAVGTATAPPGTTLVSGTSAGTGRAGYNGVLQFNLVEDLRFSCIASLTSIDNVRFWVGLFDDTHANIAGSDTLGGTIDWIGFRFSTAAGDTNFMYSYGTGGSGQYLSTGVAADTGLHCFEFRLLTNGTVDYYIDRVRVAAGVSVTTDPAAVLRFVIGLTTINGTSKNAVYHTHTLKQKWGA